MNIDPTAVIHGDGITLRRFRADDAQDLAQTAKDPDSQYWTHIPADYTPTMAEEFILPFWLFARRVLRADGAQVGSHWWTLAAFPVVGLGVHSVGSLVAHRWRRARP